MKKKLCKEIRAVANKMPVETYKTIETWGRVHPEDVGEHYKAKRRILYDSHTKRNKVNHYRRMKRMYKKGQIEALQKYIAKRLPQRKAA